MSDGRECRRSSATSEIPDAWKAGPAAVFVHIRGGGEAVGEGPWGGGAIEQTWSGLAKAGHAGVERLNALRIIPDLSHVSDPTALDVLETSRSPVVLSHGAARAIVRNARCAPDEIIRAVGESGGAMGIFMMSFWLTTDPEPSVEAYIRQIRHVINVAGTTLSASQTITPSAAKPPPSRRATTTRHQELLRLVGLGRAAGRHGVSTSARATSSFPS